MPDETQKAVLAHPRSVECGRGQRRKFLALLPVSHLLTLLLLTGSWALNSSGQSVVVSLSRNGELSCTKLEPGTVASVEWAASADGPWYTNWAALQSIGVGTNGGFRVSVPMFYRARGVPRDNRQRIVINEIQTAGTAGSADEFVELYNPETHAVDLNGFRLVYRSATGTTDTTLIHFTNSIVIDSHSYRLLTGVAYSGSAPSDGAWTGGTGALSAVGGAVALKNATDEVVDGVGWGTANNLYVEGAPAGAPASGKSIGRIPDGQDTDMNSNDFLQRTTPTPRAYNNQ